MRWAGSGPVVGRVWPVDHIFNAAGDRTKQKQVCISVSSTLAVPEPRRTLYLPSKIPEHWFSRSAVTGKQLRVSVRKANIQIINRL